MKILIVEDEKLSVDHLKTLLAKTNEKVTVLEELDSVKKTVHFLENGPKPDLIFMDIHLADGISFEVFSQLKIDIPVIFTTAYDEYAIRAFKVNSIDYLLKPIGLDDLRAAIEKFKLWSGKPLLEDKISDLIQLTQKNFKNRFMVKIGDTISSIKTEEITHFISEEGVVLLYTKSRKFTIDYTLDQLEQMLDPSAFFRINRKVIIQIDSIEKVSSYFNSRLKLQALQIADEDGIVSRERVASFKSWLDK